MELQTVFERAFALHQTGRLAEAEPLYLQVLNATPQDFAARLLLGILRADQGRHPEALDLIGGALAIHPESDLALLNHGNVLAAMQRFDEALVSYDRALAINPASADVLNGRGLLLLKMDRADEALLNLDAALALNPDFAEALNNRGVALQALKHFAEALAAYDRALALRPVYAEAYNNRANTLREMGRLDEALADIDRALALTPRFRDALHNRGNILQALKRYEDALRSYDAVLVLTPDNAKALNDRGNALQSLGRPGEALACYDRALALQPDYIDALNNRGNAHRDLLQLDMALADFDRAIALAPDAAQAYWSKSIVKLLRGDLDDGLRLYEWRKKLPVPIEARHYPQPLWTGAQELRGKTLFLYIEQGLGDTIQFYRYALLARARGARVILSVQNAIQRLMQDASAEIEILDSAGVPQAFDYHAPLMSLPLAFAATIDTIPAPIPYLRAQPERVDAWAARIGREGFKIGVCWQGAASIAGRSFPPALLAPMAGIANVRLISLQKGSGAAAGLRMKQLGDDFDAGQDGFLDSAAVMQSLDLVITLDTSLAHLAGALGRPAWVALKYVPDWRWFLGTNKSVWYPSLRLFRQSAPGDWPGVFADMKTQLLAAHRI